MDFLGGQQNNQNWASARQGQGDSAMQAQVWNLMSRAPSPIVVFLDRVSGITTTWQLLFTVSEGTFFTLQESLLYNGDAADRNFALAIVPPGETPPSGASLDQRYVIRRRVVTTGLSHRWKFDTGISFNWTIYGYTSAAAGVNANISLSGILTTYLS